MENKNKSTTGLSFTAGVYSKVVAPRFNPEEKLKRRQEIFPKDCQKAFEMGVRFARKMDF